MSKNIVVLFGSPRQDGNTDKLTAAFIEGAKSTGSTVTLFRVAKMNVNGCLGCRKCFENIGICVQHDDMKQILDAIRKADVMILASPVYYFNVTSQLKAVMDRTYPLLAEKRSTKKVALLMTSLNAGVEEGAVIMYKKMCAYFEWEPAGVIIASGLRGKNDIDGRNELEEARMFGREIGQTATILETEF
jgi:multimeric flavodoxin WrbA